MGYPGPPWPPPGTPWPPPVSPQPVSPWPPPPQRSAADIAISIVVMVLIVLLGAGASFMGLMSLAFLDYCPPESCSSAGAVNSVAGALLIAGVVGLGGMLVTIIRLSTRKTAWPFSVGTLIACIGVLVCGAIAYTISVGG